MRAKPKYPAYHDIAIHGREGAKWIRLQNDKLHKRTQMTYEQFCEAVDKEIPKALFHLVDGMPSMPVGMMAKAAAKVLHGDDPDYNYYDDFITLLFG